MGCFLACFGLSSKRKCRKPGYRDHKLCGYEPLDSVSTNLAITEKPVTSEAELSTRPKKSLNYKVRKKVSFNLNVQTYEPFPNDYWGSDEEETNKDAAKERQSSLSEGDSIESKMASYPSNYRYRNCIDSYDEEDEIAYEESDLDDHDGFDEEEEEDDDDDNNGYNMDELRVNQKEYSGQFSSLSTSSRNGLSLTKLGEDTTENSKGDSNDGGLRSRQYVHSVLKPVENLNQWKVVKARGTQPPKQQRKENVAFEQHPSKPLNSISNIRHSTPLLQEIAVDASLSNWIVLSDSYQKKTASNDVETQPSKKDCLTLRTYSWVNREDMPILDITNFES